MTQHAAPPAICPDCLGHLFKSVAGTTQIALLYCEHDGPGALLRCAVANGRIQHWVLDGPTTREEYEAEKARTLATLRRAGMAPLEFLN